jgi:hypothetical protein
MIITKNSVKMKASAKKEVDKALFEKRIKTYKSQIKELVKEFNWVDESTQMEFDLAIHQIAKRLNSTKQKYSFSKN